MSSDRDVPEWVLPEDPDDIGPDTYRAVAEWVYFNDATEADREMIADEGDELAAHIGELDYDQQHLVWLGWEAAITAVGAHISSDCEDEDVLDHMMFHYGRGARYSAIILMAATGDLPEVT